MSKASVLIIGVGNRGRAYAQYSKYHPDRIRIVAVAEPDKIKREKFAKSFGIAKDKCFHDWREALKIDKLADAVIISTMDGDHYEPFMLSVKKDYHILVEKPLSSNEKECVEMVEVAQKSKKIIATCHVLRYTPYFKKLKQIIDQGDIGNIINIQAIEPIGHKHFAHSYVRGNWRKESTSGPIILTKSCHDLDIFYWLIGSRPKHVSSFGSLKYFRKENSPKGSTEYCLDGCEIEKSCPFSARKIYLNKFNKDWPTSTITNNLTRSGILKKIKSSQFGRCVYQCDNDVCDHQVVNVEFQKEEKVSFVLSAFTHGNKKDINGKRQIRIMGTKGEIMGDFRFLNIYSFFNDKTKRVDTKNNSLDGKSRHGGGDYGLMHDFSESLINNNKSLMTPLTESIISHKMAFAAEESRKNKKIISM